MNFALLLCWSGLSASERFNSDPHTKHALALKHVTLSWESPLHLILVSMAEPAGGLSPFCCHSWEIQHKFQETKVA